MTRRFTVVGLNYRTAPLSVRGAFAFEGESLKQALQFLKEHSVTEALILSTCNRIEVYAFADSDALLLDVFHRKQHKLGSAFYQSVYRKEGDEATRHLFRVAAGLDSKILGENEIQGQLRRAWSVSKAEGLGGRSLQTLVEHAIRTGKRVRTETELGWQATSMGSVAVRTASPDGFEGRTVAVLGTGEIAQRVLREITSCERLIFSRTPSRAELVGREFGATPHHLSELGALLPKIDILFSATHSETELIGVEMLRGRSRSLTLIDLAVPATIAKEVSQIPNVQLSNIDDLSLTLLENQEMRRRAATVAESVVDAELLNYFDRRREDQVVPLVSALHRMGQEIAREQVGWAVEKLGPASEEDQRVLEALASRIVSRLLHYPLTELKRLAEDPKGLDIACRLLGLEVEANETGRVA